jgi:DNA polymerase-3 subunit epsilon
MENEIKSEGTPFERPIDKSRAFKYKKFDSELLQKNLNVENKDNPFYNKIIVVTGDFDIKRNVIADKLYSLGADINTTISVKTNFVLIGEKAGPSKMEKINKLIESGIVIKLLDKSNLYSIMSDHFEDI